MLAATDSKYTLELSVADDTPLEPGMALAHITEGARAVSHLRWTPQQGSEGSFRVLCFTGRALSVAGPEYPGPSLLSGAPRLPRVCLHISVRRCKYCVGPGSLSLSNLNPRARSQALAKVALSRSESVLTWLWLASGDTLLLKMKQFAPDMNWLRLWAANGNDDDDDQTETMDDPDQLVFEGQFHIINIGY